MTASLPKERKSSSLEVDIFFAGCYIALRYMCYNQQFSYLFVHLYIMCWDCWLKQNATSSFLVTEPVTM